MAVTTGHYPYRAPIDAYGNGGFRFADMGHRGSLLILNDGLFAWSVTEADTLSAAHLLPILARLAVPQFLLLGTGQRQVFPSADARRAFEQAHIGLDVMDTGAACRTFNILLAEGRPVMAALVATS